MKKYILAALALTFISFPALVSARVDQHFGYATSTIPGVVKLGDTLAISTTGVANITTPAPRAVTGTTDTILATDAGKTILYRSVTGVAVTLPAASATGFTTGFGVDTKNDGYGLVSFTSSSRINGSLDPFVIKQNDECTLYSYLSSEYMTQKCDGPRAYNAALGSGTMTATLDGTISYTNASAQNRYYFGSTGLYTVATGSTASRMEYEPSTLTSRGLLIEQTATNIYSQTSLSGSCGLYAGAGVTVTTTSKTFADGTTHTVGVVTETATAGAHNVSTQSTTYVAGQYYTQNIWLLAGTATSVQLHFGTVFDPLYRNVDLTDCSAGTGDADVALTRAAEMWCLAQPYGLVALTSTSTNYAFRLYGNNNDKTAARSATYDGTGKTFSFTGYQVVQSTVPQTYIPASSTREQDVVMAVTDAYKFHINPEKGGVCLGITLLENANGGVIVSDTAVSKKLLSFATATTIGYDDGTNSGDFGLEMPTAGDDANICVSYGDGTIAAALNGVLGATGTAISDWETDNWRILPSGLSGRLKWRSVFTSKLSDDDLIRLSAPR